MYRRLHMILRRSNVLVIYSLVISQQSQVAGSLLQGQSLSLSLSLVIGEKGLKEKKKEKERERGRERDREGLKEKK